MPGWYGADFEDLVHDQGEFVGWVREGRIAGVAEHPLAPRFLRAQRLQMPAYAKMSDDDLDALWAYVSWLRATRGGLDAPSAEF